MPKIIENVPEMLLAETRRQLSEKGYSAVTVRSVAAACGLGIGTVYNYFKSKDMLIATFMLEDWQRCLDTMQACIRSQATAKDVLRCIYDELTSYMAAHRSLFLDPQAAKVFYSVFNARHKQLREQLAALIRPVCDTAPLENRDFLAEFIAESLLTWTVAGRSFADQFPILNQLLK